MDWTVYWFMLPVCIAVASIAMFFTALFFAIGATFLLAFTVFADRFG
jgi:hypothetical protein